MPERRKNLLDSVPIVRHWRERRRKEQEPHYIHKIDNTGFEVKKISDDEALAWREEALRDVAPEFTEFALAGVSGAYAAVKEFAPKLASTFYTEPLVTGNILNHPDIRYGLHRDNIKALVDLTDLLYKSCQVIETAKAATKLQQKGELSYDFDGMSNDGRGAQVTLVTIPIPPQLDEGAGLYVSFAAESLTMMYKQDSRTREVTIINPGKNGKFDPPSLEYDIWEGPKQPEEQFVPPSTLSFSVKKNARYPTEFSTNLTLLPSDDTYHIKVEDYIIERGGFGTPIEYSGEGFENLPEIVEMIDLVCKAK